MMYRHLLLLGPLAILAGCGATATNKASLDPLGAGDAYHLDFDDVQEYTQGKAGAFEVKATVPAGYEAVVTAESLPEGASFDGHLFSWLPSCSLSIEEGKFYRGYLLQRVRFTLTVKNSSQILLQKTALLIVRRFDGDPSTCHDEG